MSADITPIDKARKAKANPCPQCGACAIKPHTPFCSRRCAQLDLGRWLGEDYRVPAHEAQDDADLEALLAAADKDPGLS